MAQRLIVIHGRSTKPAERRKAELLERALLLGLDRFSPRKAEKVRNGTVKVDYVYYGDVNNAILGKKNKKTRARLTARDADNKNAPCLPAGNYELAIDALADIVRFDKRAYRKILAANTDLRFIDNAARAVSTLAALITGAEANTAAIANATSDMGAYLTTRQVGSEVRERLQRVLKPALLDGDDVCVVAHSMGCMVSYDVLWKFSRMSEYRDVQDSKKRVTRWVTLGCPLGEAGVKANLYDAKERGTDKHPKNIIKTWINVAAVDDFICHDATMKGDYSAMTRNKFVESITDYKIYNCYAQEGRSNPHKFYGYLANPACAKAVSDWIK